MIEELTSRIWDRQAFQAEYQRLVQESLSQSIRGINDSSEPLDQSAIRRLLQSATHFAASPQLEHREAAYRIAIAAWQRFGTEYDNLREIALLIFGRLGNFPAADFLYQGQMELRGARLPQSVWFEMAAHEMSNSVQVAEEQNVTLTDFQKRLWDVLKSGASTALTAPTSAGKSFVLQRYLVSVLLQREGWGLYIVPTKTLINQVSASLSKLIKELGGNNLAVSTIPVIPSELGKDSGVYVLTQERLQMLLEKVPSIDFHVAIIDEAQMVADGARGIILQSVVEQLCSRTPRIQLLFGSPQTNNLQIFQQIFEFENAEIIQEQESPVAQNLILINRVPRRTKEVRVSVKIKNEYITLGQVSLEHSLEKSAYKTLAHISWIFGQSEKSLVYTGKQDSCEKIANELIQLAQGDVPIEASAVNLALVDFSEFIKEHIHPEYFLVNSILHGVAVHYGNLPSIVRKTIEEYFDEGLIAFLVCTSTLLRGVNLPAKNLFLLKPTKGGKSTAISSLEFWNLAGRAGRLGKDFEGNIFLVEPEIWKSKPFEGEKYQEVKTALSTAISEHGEAFLKFVQNKEHPSGKLDDQDIENAFVKVFNDYRQGRLPQTLDKVFGQDQSELRTRIENTIQETAEEITVPNSITERNITISVFRQQKMLDYLLRGIGEEGPEPFIPLHPLREDALNNFERLFKRIHSHFEEISEEDRSESFFALQALRWMRGNSLKRIISDNYNYKQSKQESPVEIDVVIREVLKNIGNVFRFRYVKYTNCYNDLLEEALRLSRHEEYITSIPRISLFLEIGASSQTMINLIGMGFSRTAASILAERAGNREMLMPELQQWLVRQDWGNIGISRIVLREVNRILR